MKKRKLKNNIVIYFILFGVIPLVFSSIVILYNLYLEKKENIFERHYLILKQVEGEIDGIIQNIEHVSGFIKDGYNRKQHNLVVGIPKIGKNINTMIVLDNQGTVKDFYSELKSNLFIGYDYSNTKQFKKIKKGAKDKWSEVYLSAITNTPVISYSFRVDKEHIVMLIIDLASLDKYVSRFKSAFGEYMVRLTDKNGVFISHAGKFQYVQQRKSILNTDLYKKYIKQGKQATQITFGGHSGVGNIGTYGVYDKLGWNIIVKEGYQATFENFYDIVYIVTAFVLILIVLAVYFSFRLSNTILKPLYEVSKNMGDIAKGRYKELLVKSDYEELNELIDNFVIMHHKVNDREEELKNFNDKLEQKVEEKTKELKLLNDTLEEKISIEIGKNQQKEKLLFEQSKMASMGEMIANIAHQWRQPLSVISTAASGLQVQKDYGLLDDAKFTKAMETIIKITKHLSQTIDDFRNFFKTSKEKERFSVKDILEKNLILMSSAFKANNIVVIVDGIVDCTMYGFENELTQAMLNILNNAKDALKESEHEEKYIFINAVHTEKYLILSIKDNGGGMDTKIVSKIFEPYFTTKHKAQGTGIGLYMTRQIIVDHMNGSIEVLNSRFTYKDKEFVGAEFVITLPLF